MTRVQSGTLEFQGEGCDAVDPCDRQQMNIFEYRDSLLTDYSEYVHSFIRPRSPLRTGHLWKFGTPELDHRASIEGEKQGQ